MQLLKTFFALLFTVISSVAFTQDTIVLKQCRKIKAKNIIVEPVEIKYVPFDSPDEKKDSISKEKVCMIKYQNGTKDYFTSDSASCKKCLVFIPESNEQASNSDNNNVIEKAGELFNKGEVFLKKKQEKVNNAIVAKENIHQANLDRKNSEMYLKGKSDARSDFKCGKAFWIPFTITALPLMALPGLTSACIIACKNPKESTVKKYVHSKEMADNSLYMEGFAKGAKKKRIKNAIWGFSLGLIAETIGLIIMENNGMLPKGSGSGGSHHHHH